MGARGFFSIRNQVLARIAQPGGNGLVYPFHVVTSTVIGSERLYLAHLDSPFTEADPQMVAACDLAAMAARAILVIEKKRVLRHGYFTSWLSAVAGCA